MSNFCQVLSAILLSCLVKDYDVKEKAVSFLQVVIFGLVATWIYGVTLVCTINLFNSALVSSAMVLA